MANFKEWFLQLKDFRNQRPIDDDSGFLGVYSTSATAPDFVSIYDRFGTALSNPATFTDGKLQFFTDKSITSVNLTVLTATGYAVFATAISSDEHSLYINRENRRQLLVFPFKFNSGGTVVDSGFDLPANMLIDDAFVRVTTVDATETIDVGFVNAVESGDENGLIAAASLANAGYVENAPVATGGTNIDFLAATT